jgi:DnaJ family protein C protein 17
VEDVIHKESRKKSKASALVVLSSIQAAGQAAHEVLGDLKNPLLITPYLKVMPEAQQQQQQQAGQQQDRQPPGSSTAAAAAADGARRAAGAPLFAVGGGGPAAAAAGAGGGSKPVQRPSKPLFPGMRAWCPYYFILVTSARGR